MSKYCEKCNHTGLLVWEDQEGYLMAKPCDCSIKVDFDRRIKKSGLLNLVSEYTFDKFEVKANWQKIIKDKALDFVNKSNLGNWFFIGGQVGSGKTFICTAIVTKLVEKGLDAHYMQWREESTELKMNMQDTEFYNNTLNKLKTIKVLYIDDLFKGTKVPSEADIRLAFDLINYRYINKLITIISSEMTLNEIVNVDEAIGSRIFQRSKDYTTNLAHNKSINLRLV